MLQQQRMPVDPPIDDFLNIMSYENLDGLSSEELMNAIFKDDLDDEGLVVDIEDSGLDILLSPSASFGLTFSVADATPRPENTSPNLSDDPSSSLIGTVDGSIGVGDSLQASGETAIFIGGQAEVSHLVQKELNSLDDVTHTAGSWKNEDLTSVSPCSTEATNDPAEQVYIDFSLMKKEDIEDKHKPLVGYTFDSILNAPDNDLHTLKEVSIRIKQGRDIKTFPMKLHEVLKQLEYERVINWLPHGRSFVIHDQHKLISEALPRFFNKAVKYTSFTRQLQLWGFKRVANNSDAGSYFHQLFLRGKPELAKRMVVRRSKGDKKVFLQSQTLDPDFYALAVKRPLPKFTTSSSKLPDLIKPLNVELPLIPQNAKTWGFSKKSGPVGAGSQQQALDNHSGHGRPLLLPIRGENLHNFYNGQQQHHHQQQRQSNGMPNNLNSRNYSSSQTVSSLNPSSFNAHSSSSTSLRGYPPTMPQPQQQPAGYNGAASPGQYLYPNYQGQGPSNSMRNHQQSQSMMQPRQMQGNHSMHLQNQTPMSNYQASQQQFMPAQQQQQSYMSTGSFSAPATPFSSQHGSSNGFFQQYASQSQHSMRNVHPIIPDRVKLRRHSLYEGASKQQAQVSPSGDIYPHFASSNPVDDPFEPTALEEIIESSNQVQHPPPFQMPMQRRNSC